MTKVIKRTLLSLCVFTFLFQVPTHALNLAQPNFFSGEHVLLGNHVKIYYSFNDPGQKAALLHLANGLDLTYGEILSLGDFYEIINASISQAKTNAERRERFLAAFRSFAQESSAVSEVPQIMDVIHDEIQMLQDGMNKGEKPEDIYKKIGHENDRKFNCITGGGCSSLTWFLFPGRYLLLANQDFDHFGDNALISYRIGHELAIEEAIQAHQTGDKKKLETAYAMNAFACHFLSDRFASGHIRTPRQELTDHVTPGTIGSLLAGFMHNEENASSLHVHNLRGDHWIAYGDKSYFNPKNDRHRKLIDETLQASADQVFLAYLFGLPPIFDPVIALIPQADEMGSMSYYDPSPLFYWDKTSNKLMRRSDMSNPYARHWTDDWWGWSTLIELQRVSGGLLDQAQAQLALSELGQQALQDGLITNKEIADYIKKK